MTGKHLSNRGEGQTSGMHLFLLYSGTAAGLHFFVWACIFLQGCRSNVLPAFTLQGYRLKVWQAGVQVKRLASICCTVQCRSNVWPAFTLQGRGAGQMTGGACQTTDKQVIQRCRSNYFWNCILLLLLWFCIKPFFVRIFLITPRWNPQRRVRNRIILKRQTL